MSRSSTPGFQRFRSITPSGPPSSRASPLSVHNSDREVEESSHPPPPPPPEPVDPHAADAVDLLAELGPHTSVKLSMRQLRIIKHTGLPRDPRLYKGKSSKNPGVQVSYQRCRAVAAAKEVFRKRSIIPVTPPSSADLDPPPLTSLPWPSDLDISEDDILTAITNQTTYSDWQRVCRILHQQKDHHKDVVDYLTNLDYNLEAKGKTEAELFHAKPTCNGIGLLLTYLGVDRSGNPDPVRIEERDAFIEAEALKKKAAASVAEGSRKQEKKEKRKKEKEEKEKKKRRKEKRKSDSL